MYTVLFPLDKWSLYLINNVWCIKYLLKQQKEKKNEGSRQTHICIYNKILYLQFMVIDSCPINAAIIKTEKGPNVVLRPQWCTSQSYFNFCVCLISVLLVCSFTHIVHRHTHPHMQKYTQRRSSFLSQTVCLPCIRMDLSYIACVYDDKSYI